MATGSIRKSMVFTLTCIVLLQYGLLATLAAAIPVHRPRSFSALDKFIVFGGPLNDIFPDKDKFKGG